MIEVKVKERKCYAEQYPCIKESETAPGRLVLFTDSRTGTILQESPEECAYKPGYYSTAWARGVFKPFNGEITLSNGN